MRADVAILGGGIAGVSAAARLAPLGKVVLLEAEETLGYHASGRSAAMFLEDYGNAVVCALNRASAADHRAAGVLSPRGILMVGEARDSDGFAAHAADLGLTPVDLDRAAEIWPILNRATVTHAAWQADAADLDTDRLLQDFLRRARAAGAEIVTGARIEGLTRDGTHWQVRWEGGAVEADQVVDAAGAWADRVAAAAGAAPLGLQPYRRSMARLPAPGGRDVRAWPLVLGAHDTWYAKPDAGKWLVSPCEEDPMDPFDAWADDMVLAEGLDRYAAAATEPVTRVETAWAGLRTFAPDRALVIGPDPACPGFWWCAGQGGYGFQTAPAASALLADLMAGRTPELPAEVVAALDPGRFAA
ncbi:FAD-binding oxidoreductase [Rhodobacteraceae bacterium CCMM004]|nr:FAD-binding oxidoreductase [Rhodobacteraceae bacterium CCMM004]